VNSSFISSERMSADFLKLISRMNEHHNPTCKSRYDDKKNFLDYETIHFQLGLQINRS